MRTIAIISQKGGSGKSTIALHLATAATLDGRSAAIVDLDPQGTVAAWGDRRSDLRPYVTAGQAPRLPMLVETARKAGVELLILDTAPSADPTTLRAAQVADLVLIPCRPSAFDLEAIATTLSLAQLAQKPAFVILNQVPAGSSVGQKATENLTGQGASVAPPWIGQRIILSHAVIDGRTAQECEPSGKAASEVGALYAWLCGVADLPARGTVRRAA